MADQLPPDVQAILAAARARQTAPRPVVAAPQGGFNPNVVLPDSQDYTLSNAQKGGSIAHEQVSTSGEAATNQAKAAARAQTGGADTDAEERRGAGVGVQLIENVARLHDLYRQDPTFLIPSPGEEYAAQHGATIAPGATDAERELAEKVVV